MNIMKSGPIINPFKIVTQTIMRFYLVLYIVFITGGLILSVLILNDVLTNPQTKSSDGSVSNPVTNTSNAEQLLANRLLNLEISTKNTNYQNIAPNQKDIFSE